VQETARKGVAFLAKKDKDLSEGGAPGRGIAQRPDLLRGRGGSCLRESCLLLPAPAAGCPSPSSPSQRNHAAELLLLAAGGQGTGASSTRNTGQVNLPTPATGSSHPTVLLKGFPSAGKSGVVKPSTG